MLISLYGTPYINQRILSELSGHSLGVVNKSLKSLMDKGYLDDEVKLTDDAKNKFNNNRPKNAIILAAGFGMRMVPINTQVPKALLQVDGETLVERIIKQLHDVGIEEIYIVVGFMKESFEYLIDEYGVQLIVNAEYGIKNNLHSLRMAASNISNTYVVPGDIWCKKNPFSKHELYSWYMVTDLVDDDSEVRVNRKMELVSVSTKQGGNSMLGFSFSYLVENEAEVVRKRLLKYDTLREYNDSFWESTLYEGDRMILPAKLVHATDFVEINTYEQLRELDEGSNNLKSDAISIISEVLKVKSMDIVNIAVLKKGMTNRSFLFTCLGKKYIMRIPGEGTDKLINRKQEAAVYNAIDKKGIADDVIYMNSENGYKITEFLEGSRVCDINSIEDLQCCMSKLKEFHSLNLKVEHTFDIFKQIEFYESLWNNQPSIYKDYLQTKERIFSLKEYIEKQDKQWCLAHIDAVPDNFLFTENGDIRLIDWEYAGMQDPHVDLAMFCIYALYEKDEIDQLIDIYFGGNCKSQVRIKIYCYIAVCGLLWSNWCEYKRSCGVEFGEYSLRQYRYAKEYYKLVKGELDNA